MTSINNWFLGSKHPFYGKVVAMACIEGEPYRFFRDSPRSISMIPLSTLQLLDEEDLTC